MKIGQYAKVTDAVVDATDAVAKVTDAVPSAAPSGVVAAAKTAGQTVDQTAEDEGLKDRDDPRWTQPDLDESTSEFVGPLQPRFSLPWSEDYQRQAALLGDVATRAAERRDKSITQHPGMTGTRPWPLGQRIVTDPETLQMTESPASMAWRAVGLSGVNRLGFAPIEDVERYQAEQQLRKIPPTESAVQLSGVGPGTGEQPLVKAVEPGYSESSPGSTGEVPRLKALSEPWWSPVHRPSGSMGPLPIETLYRPEGTSWFIPEALDRKGFDKVKVREKLLAPAEEGISGKMHFGHTKGVKSEDAVFSEGDISLPRLTKYYKALVAEQKAVEVAYQTLIDEAEASLTAPRVSGKDRSRRDEELRRLDADIKRVRQLQKVLEKIATVAGISEVEIGDAVNWQGVPKAIRRPEGD